jgi:asparagine synthase (glutamine-hydrolysing)
MCGLTGILGPKADLKTLRAMTRALAHRGPDGEGFWHNASGRVALGHRRLAIIDPAAAAGQPMVSPDGTLALIFNGEIYNHAEVRQELIKLGVKTWQTDHSDTEVILQAYKKWGMPRCLEKLRGMFAFALWDEEQQTLFAARDRVGERPFYYATAADGSFIFASEINALLAYPYLRREVDEEAFFHYLSFLMVPPPRTLLKGVHKLAAGHWLAWKKGRVTTHRYWQPLAAAQTYAATHALPAAADEAGWLAHLQPILHQSVRLRQEAADVPVGVFLSGGLDSSTIAALVGGRTSHGRLHTLAIGPEACDRGWPDETPYAGQVAKRIGSRHTTLRLSQAEALKLLPDFIARQDEPVADPASLPLMVLARAAHNQGLKVCQGGEGGDELFVGYDDWLKFAKLERWNRRFPLPGWLKYLSYRALIAAGLGHRFYAEYLRRAALGQPIFWGGAEAFTSWEKHRLLHPRLRRQFARRSSYEVIAPLWEAFQKAPAGLRHFWNWCTSTELQLRLPEQLLMKGDKMTMASALELRLPLLDPELVAAALCTPPELRAPGGDKKHLLKGLVKGLLPRGIIDRKKQGLMMPLDAWLLKHYGSFARRTLQRFCARTAYLNWPAVERLFAQGRGQHVWYLLNFALWHQRVIEGKAIEVPGAYVASSRHKKTGTKKPHGRRPR